MVLPSLQGVFFFFFLFIYLFATGPLKLEKMAYKTFFTLLSFLQYLALPDFNSAIVYHLCIAGDQNFTFKSHTQWVNQIFYFNYNFHFFFFFFSTFFFLTLSKRLNFWSGVNKWGTNLKQSFFNLKQSVRILWRVPSVVYSMSCLGNSNYRPPSHTIRLNVFLCCCNIRPIWTVTVLRPTLTPLNFFTQQKLCLASPQNYHWYDTIQQFRKYLFMICAKHPWL